MNEIIEKKRKKKESRDKNDIFSNNYHEKIQFYQKLIQETMLSIQKYKFLDIITANELNITINNLEQIINNLSEIDSLTNKNIIAEKLQNINDSLFDVFKQFGTSSVNDLLAVSFGNNFINKINQHDKYKIIDKYVNPLSFKILNSTNNNAKKTPLIKNKIIEDFMIAENSNNFECFDLGRTTKIFQLKVYGIKIAIRNKDEKKILILNGLTKDLMLSSITDKIIIDKIKDLKLNKPEENDYKSETFNNFIESLSIKDLLIYNNEEIYFRFAGTINQLNLIKQKNISQVVKDFLTSELYSQRRTIINLLLSDNNAEFQYLAYLLYDLMSNDINGNIDTHEQTCLFDSLPWNIKKKFRLAMKQTIQYTNKLTNFDSSKIPLEQQICLLKANDVVKEKAMVKLKEVKAKTDDSGSKARQYLEGLLKIPFGIYVKEPILSNMKIINNEVNDMKNLLKNITKTNFYDSINCYNLKDTINKDLYENINKVVLENIFTDIKNKKRNDLINIVSYINKYLKNSSHQNKKIIYSGIKQSLLKKKICDFLLQHNNNDFIVNFIKDTDIQIYEKDKIINLYQNMKTLSNRRDNISTYMNYTNKTLEEAVHGHSYAKRQIERIIGQWITGEMEGYCFGFEGPPGVGKTSLAQKGISKCLLDQNNISRPFSFIAVGGSSNGSTFEGHNYTYVGSTWGKIVDVLIESKCMNPIIFIDELDKISKTEHGKEIIGILTHLIDPTQNKGFQDKYFSGIELDLSKALFIFSYNNAEIIDKILLDRIHRIKFKHLTIEEKITITNKYLLPELYKKMGINNYIKLTDDVISFIINEYTYEAGVRNLKQHLFDIIGEINLNLLLNNFDKQLPYLITIDEVKNIYLKEKTPIRPTLIHKNNSVGIINGLWANASGKGGIIQIETNFFASNTLFELKLTGSQGDIMKESMNVAKTLAWNSIDDDSKKLLMKRKENSNQGIHIHCPEGSVPKDGPSAGTAITVALFSLFTNKKIKNDFAITGEISLQGNVTEIGGLDLKILGGIQGGVKSFIFPEKNKKEFNEFMEKYKNKDIIKNINFYPVNTFDEVLKLILV